MSNTYVPSLQVQFSRKVKGLPAGKLFDKRTTCQKAQWTTWAASTHAPKCSVQFTQCWGVSSESFSVHFSDIPALVKIDSFPFTQCLSCTHCKNGCVESTCDGAPSTCWWTLCLTKAHLATTSAWQSLTAAPLKWHPLMYSVPVSRATRLLYSSWSCCCIP